MTRKTYHLRPLRRRVPAGQEWIYPFIARWQNNAPGDLGILRFGFDLFDETLLDPKFGVAGWVSEAFEQILEFYPAFKKTDRAHVIRTYRDGSKTTWMQIFILYLILVGDYGIYWEDNLLPDAKFIRYRGKTFDEADKKVDTIRMELITNQKLIRVFGEMTPTFKEVKRLKLRDNVKLMMLKNGKVIRPFGLNQPSRGDNIRGMRPDIDINDDVEDNKNTKTESLREHNYNDVIGDQFGGIKDNGMLINILNLVHPDAMGAKFIKNPDIWRIQDHTATKFIVDPDTGEETEVSDWERRFSVSYYKKLERFFTRNGKYHIFRREYYNEIISEMEYKLIYFNGKYVRREGHNWLEVEQPDGSKKLINCFIVVSADPAISEDKRASDSAIVVNAFCSDGQRRVIDLSLGKFDINDRFANEEDRPAILATTPEEMSRIIKKGTVQEVARKVMQYNANAWVIEKAGQQLGWYNDTKDLLKRLGKAIPSLAYKPTEKKETKLTEGLMNRFSAGNYEIYEKLPHLKALEASIRQFPSKMDILDAIFNSEQIGRVPKRYNIDLYGMAQQHSAFEIEDKKNNQGRITRAHNPITNPKAFLGEAEAYVLI